MPPVHHYIVTQERETTVIAESPTDAIILAKVIFDEQTIADNPKVREIEVRACKEY